MAKMTGSELARAVGDFVNGADEAEIKEFVQEIVYRTHRTLQQNTMKLVLKLIEEWGNLSIAHYDLRNEATVVLCQKIINTFDKYDRSLPLI